MWRGREHPQLCWWGRGTGGLRIETSEGETVALAWAVGRQSFGWCNSRGEGGCTLEKGTLHRSAGWLDVSPGFTGALRDGKQWRPSTSRGQCWVSVETQSRIPEIKSCLETKFPSLHPTAEPAAFFFFPSRPLGCAVKVELWAS